MNIKKLYLEEVNSTNLYAKEHLDDIDDRTIVYTYNQTSGRGRLDRKWKFVGCDNIYASFVLKPFNTLEPVCANITQYLSVVLARMFEVYGVEARIKWPNDVLVNGKKAAGILSEGIVRGNELSGIVLGVGINLNGKKESFIDIEKPATALNLEVGGVIDKENFLEKLYSNFFLYYDKFLSAGFLYIRDDYIKRASFLNQTIKVSGSRGILEGAAVDITHDGALVLQDDKNNIKTLWIGDIL